MNERVWKEVRQLAPTWIVAIVLVSLPLHEILPAAHDPGADASPTPKIIALILGLLFLSVSSFGREFTHNTFQLFLSQPVSRRQLWREKVGILGAATVSVWLVFWMTYSFSFGFSAWVAGMTLAAAFGLMGTGLWVTLMFRQVVAALCFSMLIPAVLIPLIGFIGGPGDPAWARAASLAAAALYAAVAYWFARWLFLRAQDLYPEFLDLVWFAGRKDPSSPAGGFHRRGSTWTLAVKELRLQEINFLSGFVVFLVLGVLAAVFALRENATAFANLETAFGLMTFLMPVLVGAVAIAEERKLGMLEIQQVLPVSRWRQFGVKTATVYGAILLLGVAVPWLVTLAVGGFTGAPLKFLILANLVGGDSQNSTVLAVLTLIALFTGTVALFVSSMAQNTPAAVLGTIALLAPLWVIALVSISRSAFVPVVLLVALAVGVLLFLTLSFTNFPRFSTKFWSDLETAGRTLAIGTATFALLAVTGWGVLDLATGAKLRRAIDAWHEAGLTMDVRDYAPPPAPRDENAVVVLEEVINIHGVPEFYDRDVGAKEREAVNLASEILPRLERAEMPAESVEELEKLLAYPAIAERLETAREASEYPRLDIDLDYELGYELLLPHVGGLRQLARMLQAEAVLRAAQGRWSEAYENLAASHRLGELMRDEPFLISRLTQLAIRNMVYERLAVFLRAQPANAETVDHWRELLSEDGPILLDETMRFEILAVSHWLHNKLEAGEFNPSEFFADPGRPKEMQRYIEWLDEEIFRPLHKADLATLLDVNRRRIAMWQKARQGEVRMEELQEWQTDLEKSLPWYAVVTPHILFDGSRLLESQNQSVARFELARTSLAAHAYRAAKNEWPGTLDDLVPEYLPELPNDPFDNERIRFSRDDRRIILYSIGPNRTDDGGLEVKEVRRNEPGDIVWVLEKKREREPHP